MKRILICTLLSLGMILPGISQARGDHDGGYGHGYQHERGGDYDHVERHDYDRGHGWGYGDDHESYHRDDFGRAAILPFILGAAVVGAVANIVTAPAYVDDYAPPPVVYYPPQPVYSYAPAPPQTCTYYPDGSSYCR